MKQFVAELTYGEKTLLRLPTKDVIREWSLPAKKCSISCPWQLPTWIPGYQIPFCHFWYNYDRPPLPPPPQHWRNTSLICYILKVGHLNFCHIDIFINSLKQEGEREERERNFKRVIKSPGTFSYLTNKQLLYMGNAVVVLKLPLQVRIGASIHQITSHTRVTRQCNENNNQ